MSKDKQKQEVKKNYATLYEHRFGVTELINLVNELSVRKLVYLTQDPSNPKEQRWFLEATKLGGDKDIML